MAALRQTTGLARALLLAGLLVLLAETVAFCLYGTSVYDEGGYLYEGWATVAHGQLPFRDFFAKLPPLLYYVYGVGQALCGPSLLVGRVESALFLFGALALSAAMARRLAGPWAAVLLVWLTAGNPFALNYYLHAYAVAPTAFFVALTLALLILPRPGPAALLAANAAAAATLLCRQDLLPLVAVLWALMLWRYPVRPGWRVAGLIFSLVVFGLVLLPFALQAPGNVLQTLTIGKLGPRVPAVGGYAGGSPDSLGVVAWHILMFLRAYAGVLLLLTTALAARSVAQPESPGGSAFGDAAAGWALGGAALLWLSHIPAALAIGGSVFYLLDPYVFFSVALAATVWFVRVVGSVSGVAPAAARALMAVAVCAVAMVLFTGHGPRFEFSLRQPTDLERIRVGAAALKQHIPPGATIFTIDDPQQFLEAGLLLPGPLTHQLFSYREETDTALLRRVHMYNDEMIRQWLTGGAQYVVISAAARDFMRHSGRYRGGERLDGFIMGLVQANYAPVAEVSGSWAGPMAIYRWRGER